MHITFVFNHLIFPLSFHLDTLEDELFFLETSIDSGFGCQSFQGVAQGGKAGETGPEYSRGGTP